jgi:AcrR family transcriptional regulator
MGSLAGARTGHRHRVRAMTSQAARPRRRRLDAAARRETILDAAISAFAAAGYDQTRVSDIAATVGVTEPVVFQNFGTKADLFAAVLDRISEDGAGQMATIVDGRGDVIDLVSRFLAPDVQERMHTSGGLGVLYAEADARGEESIREAFRRALARTAEGMAAILRRGQAEGSIRGDVDPSALAWLVLSLVRAHEFRRAHSEHRSPALERELLAAVLGILRPHPAENASL